jgi:hypothetical protein
MKGFDGICDNAGARGHDQWGQWRNPADVFEHMDAVHFGHAQVDDHQVRLFFFIKRQTHASVFRGKNPIPAILQVGTKTVPDGFLIINDQDSR